MNWLSIIGWIIVIWFALSFLIAAAWAAYFGRLKRMCEEHED